MQVESLRSTSDPATHNECLEFIRQAIAEADRQTAHQVAGILKEVYEGGHVDRAKIWNDLTPSEQTDYRVLLTADTPDSPPPPHRTPGEFELGDRVITPSGERVTVTDIWYGRDGKQECWVLVDGCTREFQASELAADCLDCGL